MDQATTSIEVANPPILGNIETKQLSKKQQKKMAKMARWLEGRKEKRIIEKARRKEKRAQLHATGVVIPKPVKKTMASSNCKIRVAVDMAYEDKMDERLIRNTIAQLNYCYAANRRAANPMQYYIINFNGFTKTIFESNKNNQNWDAYIVPDRLEDLWQKDEIVYLCAESETDIEVLDPGKVYVIGGLIDHNRYKGFCYEKAVANGFSTARLPIDKYMKMNSRKVLTINHVFEILLRFSETNSWIEALKVIPKRKGITFINSESAEENEPQDEDTGEKATLEDVSNGENSNNTPNC
uniref:tRNA (guanine(9)-N(1))-methyltransferase n=1 Tax=Acrobeloides nanus TaxID=290746 RepID=A0A914CSB6_9BILA